MILKRPWELPLTGIVAGVPVVITVGLNPGTEWEIDHDHQPPVWASIDKVSYTEVTLSLDSGQVLRDQRPGNFDRQFTMTFPRRGTYQAVAVGLTSEGPLAMKVAPASLGPAEVLALLGGGIRIHGRALFQRRASPEMLPSTLAADNSVIVAPLPLGTMLGGPLVAGLGARPTLFACALTTVALGLTAAMVRGAGPAMARYGTIWNAPW